VLKKDKSGRVVADKTLIKKYIYILKLIKR